MSSNHVRIAIAVVVLLALVALFVYDLRIWAWFYWKALLGQSHT